MDAPIWTADRPLGRHLGTGPGLERTIETARRIGCTAAQIFPGNPKGWRHVPLAPARAAAARAAWTAAGVAPLTIHAPYIINLASPEEALYTLSRQGVRNALDRAVELGARSVTVHLGSHKGTGHAAGAARLIDAVGVALAGLPEWLCLLLENNVGAGNSMGPTLANLGDLIRAAAHPRLGVCIDTAHLWGAGHDITSAEGVDRVVEAIDQAIGLPHVRVLHVNDSPVPLGSRRDQHAHLGQGNIGYEGLAAVLTHPAFAGIPVILETPDGGEEEEVIRLCVAALLCAGDAPGARALQESSLPLHGAAAADVAEDVEAALV